jgi:hypothetical protein
MPGEAFVWPEPEEINVADMEAGYAAMRADIEGMAEEDCPQITIDVDEAASTVWSAIPKIALFREKIDLLPEVPPYVAKLRNYALGVMYAQLQIQLGDQEVAIAPMAQTVATHRDTLVEDLSPLVRRGLVPGDFKEQLQPLVGFRNAANGALLVCAVARKHWAAIDGKSAITLEFLTEVEQLAGKVLTALAARETRGRSIDPTGERLRAVALLTDAYDQSRRALNFLFWRQPGRLDQVAPSLYKRGRADAKDAVEPVVVTPPVNPDAPKPVVEAAPADGPLARPFGD